MHFACKGPFNVIIYLSPSAIFYLCINFVGLLSRIYYTLAANLLIFIKILKLEAVLSTITNGLFKNTDVIKRFFNDLLTLLFIYVVVLDYMKCMKSRNIGVYTALHFAILTLTRLIGSIFKSQAIWGISSEYDACDNIFSGLFWGHDSIFSWLLSAGTTKSLFHLTAPSWDLPTKQYLVRFYVLRILSHFYQILQAPTWAILLLSLRKTSF